MNQQVSPPPQPPDLIQRLRTAQLRLAAVALVTMMTGTALDVFFRYAFNKPLRFSYDLVESMLVIYVFHGISSVFLERRNIVIDVIDSLVVSAAVPVGNAGACDAGVPVWRSQA